MKKSLIMLFCVCAGIVFGSLVAHLSKGVSWLSWLTYGMDFGITSPFVLDLSVLKLTIGAVFNLNISVIIFIVIGVLVGLGLIRKR